jgi:hypothetical protein
MARIFEIPPLLRKKGRSISVDRKRRQAAIAIGGALVSRIKIEAVETATMLTSSAKFGGTLGFSPNIIPMILRQEL